MSDAGSSDAGTLIEIDGRPTLRFERWLPAPIERVWRAVTDENEMQAWFPSRVEGDRAVGAPLRFPFDDDPAPTFEGEVVEWNPPRAFAFTWNDDVLRFELATAHGGTTLVFTQTIQDRTEAARTGAGWHACFDALVVHMGGDAGEAGDWEATFTDYLRRMGPPRARTDGNVLVFERSHYLSPDELRVCIDDWGGGDGATFAIEAAPYGSSYEVRVPIDDPVEAAGWHAALVELDMYAASGRRVQVERDQFIDDYRRLLT